MTPKGLIVAGSAALLLVGTTVVGVATAVPAFAVGQECTTTDVLVVDRNADLTAASVRLAPGSTADCYVSLHAYQTDGPTWPTSGNQVEVGFSTVHLTDVAQLLNVSASECFGQNDLVIGPADYTGANAPHYPNRVFTTTLLDTWTGGSACKVVYASQTPSDSTPPVQRFVAVPSTPIVTPTPTPTVTPTPVVVPAAAPVAVLGEQLIAPAVAPTSSSSALPFTGAPVIVQLGLAGGLILGGGALAAAATRRRRRSATS